MRLRMPLIYATTAQEAAKIIKDQRIPSENRPNIAGKGRYFWENIPDARTYSMTGTETFLVADVYFPNCYENRKSFPHNHHYKQHDTFWGDFENTHYYMVKYNDQIERIHYIYQSEQYFTF